MIIINSATKMTRAIVRPGPPAQHAPRFRQQLVGLLHLQHEKRRPINERTMKMTNGALTNAGIPTSNQYWTRPLPFQGSAPDGEAVSSSSRSSAVSLKLARPERQCGEGRVHFP